VAIDEPTAIRCNFQPDTLPKWTQDRFKHVTTVEEFDEDLKEFTKAIQNDVTYKNVNFRVFSTDVVIRGSKWSRDPSS
jgi:hypothetical protein